MINHAWLDRLLLIWIMLSLNSIYLWLVFDKFNVNCNFLSPKICVSEKKKDTNAKAFNVISNKNEAKSMTCDCKCKLNGIIKQVNVSVKFIAHEKWL